jgi:hypothetical protein
MKRANGVLEAGPNYCFKVLLSKRNIFMILTYLGQANMMELPVLKKGRMPDLQA